MVEIRPDRAGRRVRPEAWSNRASTSPTTAAAPGSTGWAATSPATPTSGGRRRAHPNGWHVLRRTTFDYLGRNGTWSRQQRETYDRGNGATILLYDAGRRTVLLTRQFRYPAYVNGHPDGMLVETAAGLLDDDDPETAIRREASEETRRRGRRAHPRLRRLHEPGLGHRAPALLRRALLAGRPDGPRGGGLADEGEDIEVLELPFDEALAMIRDGAHRRRARPSCCCSGRRWTVRSVADVTVCTTAPMDIVPA